MYNLYPENFLNFIDSLKCEIFRPFHQFRHIWSRNTHFIGEILLSHSIYTQMMHNGQCHILRHFTPSVAFHPHFCAFDSCAASRFCQFVKLFQI